MKMNSSKLQGVKVILCTLSMLSNTRITVFTKVNPLHTLVVDEASQIEIGDYIPVFSAFKNSLRKVCFIGDDKQCKFLFTNLYIKCVSHSTVVPPFGQEDVEDLQSIFEVIHLKKHVLFLDTQCELNIYIYTLKF
jgi:superfamily I DNA and/or RNA helicase